MATSVDDVVYTRRHIHALNVKVERSILHTPEQAFINWIVPRIPTGVTSIHLTLASIPLSVGIFLSGWLVTRQTSWLYVTSALVAIQWLTDSLDGALGRYRRTGLARWGYYTDHLLDFFFLASIYGCYKWLSDSWLLPAVFVLASALMVSCFLVMGAAGRFQIARFGVGPTEGRIGVIVVNAVLIIFGLGVFEYILAALLILLFIGLIATVNKESNTLWDMDAKDRDARKEMN